MGHSTFPFWNPSIQANYYDPYIDTFSVCESFFRVVHTDDSSGTASVERFNSSKWDSILTLEYLGNHNVYDRSLDVNRDGYVDFVYRHKWSSEAYLFDPKVGNFSDAPLDILGCTLLDRNKQIFCCFHDSKRKNQYSSELFILKNLEIEVLFSLKFVFEQSKDGEEKLKKVILYNNKQKKLREIKVITSEFDDTKFWKLNYKKLLGYS